MNVCVCVYKKVREEKKKRGEKERKRVEEEERKEEGSADKGNVIRVTE